MGNDLTPEKLAKVLAGDGAAPSKLARHSKPLVALVDDPEECLVCGGDGMASGYEPELCGEGEDRPCEACKGTGWR
jgi:hypothetical protein